MNYLDEERLEELDHENFRTRRPYPWMNPARLLTETGYQQLLESLPDPALFEPCFGHKRSHRQQSHDRLALEYQPELAVSHHWHAFVEELQGQSYGRCLRRMFGRGRMRLSFHWHFTPSGCSVSPHCDARRKLGSHIFYFNTEQDWNPAWGGETLILDDAGKLPRKSAPRFEDFSRITPAKALGNRSLLFARQDHSWHGIRELRCPEGAFRKVFIVVINDWLLALRRGLVGRLAGEHVAGY